MKRLVTWACRVLLGLLVLGALFGLSRHNYLLFHSIAELFTLVILYSIGLLVWNSARRLDNSFLLLLGIAFPFIGILNLMHLLAYKGMGVFGNGSANPATQLWIAQRYLIGLSFLGAALIGGRRLRAAPLLGLYGAIVILLLGSIFYWRNFPACLVDGSGLTLFKKFSEFIIVAIFLLATALTLRRARHFEPDVLRRIVAAIILSAVTDLMFTLYNDPYQFTNMLGHLLNVTTFYLIYQALVVTAITKPQDLLYRNLRLSEETLRLSEQRYRSLVEAAPNMIAITRRGRLVYLNPCGMSWLGVCCVEQWAGKALLDFIGAEHHPLFDSLEPRLRQKSAILLGEAALCRPGGTPVTVEAMAILITDRGEPAVQFLMADITARKQHEAEREQARTQLETLAARLQQMNRAKDDFIAMMGHELRNPLAPVLNSLYVLNLRGTADANQRRLHDLIERQVRHMARLVDDLLDVSRITRGKVALRQQPVELVKAIRHAVESCEGLFKTRRHELTLSLPESPVMLEADPTRLEQILVNLLTNAAKYTEPGGHVWLSVESRSGELLIRVRDNGMGLSPEMLGKIFEPFSQAERSLDRAQGGLGLGLTLVRSLVQLHGGRIEASSPGLGRGSEFTVSLPLLCPLTESLIPPLPVGAGPLRVMVIEDNPDAASTLGELIRLWGHEPVTVSEGRQALERAIEVRPDVVLLDIGLPDLDGYRVARILRAEPALAGITIAAMTGYDQRETRERSREAGCDFCFTKPIDLRELRQLLARRALHGASR